MRRSTESVQEQAERHSEHVGRKLKLARTEQGLSLEEIGQDLKIHAHHLGAIEEGDFEALPNPIWMRGLLVRYADHLGLEGEKLAEDFFQLRRPPRTARYMKGHRRWLIAVGALVVAVIVSPAVLILFPDSAIINKVEDALHSIAPDLVLGDEPQRVALLGSGGAGIAGTGNIVSLTLGEDGYEVRSIPENTLTKVPGYGTRRIADAVALGGPDLTRQTVAQLTDAEVQHYLMVGPEGVKGITDEIGGVRVNVPNLVSGKPSVGGPTIRLTPGRQTLSGDEVLVYLQGQDLSSETELAVRQQEVLFAVFEQALGPGQLLSHPTTASTLLEQTETNMTPLEAVQLALRLGASSDSDSDKETSSGSGRE